MQTAFTSLRKELSKTWSKNSRRSNYSNCYLLIVSDKDFENVELRWDEDYASAASEARDAKRFGTDTDDWNYPSLPSSISKEY